MDAVEENEDENHSCNEAEENDDDYDDDDEVEIPVIQCHSEDCDQIDIFVTDAAVEDLGKRKGTNAAREEIVKKLRQTPPNPSTSHGGFRSVPV